MKCPVCDSLDHAQVASKAGYPIHRCGSCTVLFVHPFPSSEALSEFYNNYHKTKQYKDKVKSKTKRAGKRIASLGRRGDLSFLDVGCNIGFATEAGRSLGYRALGIDVDADAIERAKVLFPEASFRCLPIQALAAEGKTFDVVYSSEVIEHLVEPLDFLRAIRAVMADGAVLFLTTPDVGHFSLPRAPHKLVQWDNFRPPEHLLYFNKKSLKLLFQRAGFTRVKFRFGFKPTMKVVASK
jgi:2-polyprenyl-3-methyl-5-hydroxy-6-metoxy-1,4-benzoquinol methylase